MAKLSWIPKPSGERYCAPACGRGCTRAEFNKATKDAKALVATLGEGWQANVFENLGWHYAAISACGRWKVYPSIYGGVVEGYTAFLGEADSGGGRWAEHGATPQEAIANTRAEARKEVGHFMELLDMAQNA